MRRVATVVMASAFAAAQTPAPLLVSRTDGSGPVAPGQTITIHVTSPAGLPLEAALLISEAPIGTHLVPTIPGEVRVPIPRRLSLRPYALTAMAGGSGKPVTSKPLEIDVERTDLPVRLQSQWSSLSFEGPTVGIPMMLQALFADGTLAEVSESSRLAYRTSDTTVATVQRGGVVTPIAPGVATASAIYSVGSRSVRLDIPVTVEVPAIAPSRYTIGFGQQRLGGTRSETLTLTNRRPHAVSILDLKAIGDSFSQTNDCPASLAPGAACQVTVTFAPTQANERHGELELANSFSAEVYSVALSGVGVR